MMKRIPVWCKMLVCLFVFGLIRVPVESSLRKQLTESKMLLPLPGQTGMEQLGQSALMGTLGGLRSLVASYLILESFHHFSNEDWDENKRSLLMATFLEPTEESHWVSLVWHRGINATAWVELRSGLPEFERKLRFQEYALDAIELGNAGLKQLPKSVQLRLQIVEVYKEKLKDPNGMARIYKELIDLDEAPSFVSRFYGYALTECVGKEQEAYDHLFNLYWEAERNHMPTLIKNILVLQEKLDIPYPQRIPEKDPDVKRQMRALNDKPRPPLPGGIRLP